MVYNFIMENRVSMYDLGGAPIFGSLHGPHTHVYIYIYTQLYTSIHHPSIHPSIHPYCTYIKLHYITLRYVTLRYVTLQRFINHQFSLGGTSDRGSLCSNSGDRLPSKL